MKRNVRQVIVDVYLLLPVLVCLYVPWQITDGLDSAFWGYSVIWSPPGGVLYANTFKVYIHLKRVFLEIVAITVVAAGAYSLTLVLEREKRDQKTKETEEETKMEIERPNK